MTLHGAIHTQKLAAAGAGGGFQGLGTWRYRTETTEPPSSGQIRFDNGTITSATILWVHDTNDNSTDMGAFLNLLEDGNLIYIQDKGDNTSFVVVEISSRTDDGSYVEFGLQTIIQEGTAFSQNDEVLLVVSQGANTVATLQSAYNAATAAPQITAASGAPVSFRAFADPDTAFQVQRNSGDQILLVSSLASGHSITLGPAGNRSWFAEEPSTDSNPTSLQFIPDGRTKTVVNTLTNSAAMGWYSTFISDIPAGGAIGNDAGFGMVFAAGTLQLNDSGNLFSTSIVFNQATVIDTTNARSGPVYTMVNQPRCRNTGGTNRTMSQSNAVRSQMRVEATGAGDMTLTSHEPYFAVITLDGTGGAGDAIATTVNYFAPKAPGFITAGDSIGTLNVMDIPNIPATQITTLRGINSAMSSGTFINHTGSANSLFSGPITMANAVELRLGGATANDVALDRSAADTMRWTATGVIEWDLNTATANAMRCFSTGDGLLFDFPAIAFGVVTADPTANWQVLFGPGTKTVTLGGDFSRRLFSASGAVTINAAMSNVFTDTINEPFITLGTGSVTNAGNVLIQTSPSVGTNRYGLLITANPSGGTLNYALRVTNGDARFDGRTDINNGIALGGGAAATLGTIGGSGPTAAAQAQWLEIDIGGVAHWIPVWT